MSIAWRVGNERQPSQLPHHSTGRQNDSIGRADFNAGRQTSMQNLTPDTLEGDDGTNFSEPTAPYNAEYPHNHVYESEAGHIREMDDTPVPRENT